MAKTPSGEQTKQQKSTMFWCPRCSSERKGIGECRHEGARLLEVYSENDEIDGTYVVIECLGAGGMGVVYKCLDKNLDKIVALKALIGRTDDPERLMRFQREAQAMGKLNHENLVSILNFGITGDGKPYMAMEYLEGVTLDHYLAERLSPEAVSEQDEATRLLDIIDIFIRCCDGLAYAHQQGVLHRDLKPENIMLIGPFESAADSQRRVKVLDFGIAKLSQADSGLQFRTKTGSLFGTPHYMSPEQCRGEAIDERSDIYSLGCVLFEALSGRRPFEAESLLEILNLHINQPAPKLDNDAILGDCGFRLQSLISKLLAKNAADRMQSMKDLKAELERIELEQHKVKNEQEKTPDLKSKEPAAAILTSPVVAVAATDQDTIKKKRRFGLTTIALAILVLCLAAGITLSMIQHRQHVPQKAVAKAMQNEIALNPLPVPVNDEDDESEITADKQLEQIIDKAGKGDEVLIKGSVLAADTFSDRQADILIKANRSWASIHFNHYFGLTAARLEKLKALKVPQYVFVKTDLNDEALKTVAQFPALEKLYIDRCLIDDDGLANLAQNKKLRLLRAVRMNQLSVKSVQALCTFAPNLKKLSLSQCTGIDNSSLPFLLKRCQPGTTGGERFVKLNLSGTSVNRVGMPFLKRMKSLRMLNLSACEGIGKKEADELRLSLPATNIIVQPLPCEDDEHV